MVSFGLDGHTHDLHRHTYVYTYIHTAVPSAAVTAFLILASLATLSLPSEVSPRGYGSSVSNPYHQH